jgi:hypothetical protein
MYGHAHTLRITADLRPLADREFDLSRRDHVNGSAPCRDLRRGTVEVSPWSLIWLRGFSTTATVDENISFVSTRRICFSIPGLIRMVSLEPYKALRIIYLPRSHRIGE